MNILHFDYDNPLHPTIAGGGAFRNLKIYKRFPDEYKINILTSFFTGEDDTRKLDNIEYTRLCKTNKRFSNRINYGLLRGGLVNKLVEKADIIIDDFTPLSPILRLPMKSRKIPIVALVQNIFDIQLIKKYRLLGIPAYFFERLGITRYHNFIAVSDSIKNKIIQMNNFNINEIEVIPNGVDDEFFTVQQNNAEDFILFLGRLDIYQKGIDLLIRVFKRVSMAHSNLKLVIAGDGNDLAKVKREIKDSGLEGRVVLPGRVSGSERLNLLAGCMFLIMPSRYESWGMSAMEASAAGKAIVGTDIDGLNYVVKNNKTGLLVKCNDGRALYEAVVYLIENKNVRIRFGEEGRKWASNFNWDKIASKQDAFYKKIIKRHRDMS